MLNPPQLVEKVIQWCIPLLYIPYHFKLEKIGFSLSKVMDNFLGWRRKLLNWYRYFGHAIFYAAGFRIKIIGKQATRQEAPILVGAPHSSFLEVSSTF